MQNKTFHFLIILLVISGLALPAKARDKNTVVLQCSTTKIVLTCTKFAGGHCINSILYFNTAAGSHRALPAEKIPQNFVVPAIADYVWCIESNGKFAVDVYYSPGCQYDGCIALRTYDLQGKNILVQKTSRLQDYFRAKARDIQVISKVSLRGDE
ncbi:MAG: hypothetical protein KGK02_00965 [Rhodospirillales bacterium]|nr:hypothetical protein [Rhodospirillales bacterium]